MPVIDFILLSVPAIIRVEAVVDVSVGVVAAADSTPFCVVRKSAGRR